MKLLILQRIIMIKTTISTVRLFFSRISRSNSSTVRPPPKVPQYYNVGRSIHGNIASSKSFSQIFTIYSVLRSHFRDAHLAHTSQVLLDLVWQHRKNDTKNMGQLFVQEKLQKGWKMFLEDMTHCEIDYLSKEALMDFVHFLYKSQQSQLTYSTVFPQMKATLQHFQRALLQRVTSGQVLSQYSIADLVELLHKLIIMKQLPETLAPVLDEIELKLEKDPFCTIFDIMLMFSHLRYLKSEYNLHDEKANGLKTVMISIVEQQLPTILPYIEVGPLTQLYLALNRSRSDLLYPILHRLQQLLHEYSQNQIANFNSNLKRTLLIEIPLFIKVVRPVEGIDVKYIISKLSSFKGPFKYSSKSETQRPNEQSQI